MLKYLLSKKYKTSDGITNFNSELIEGDEDGNTCLHFAYLLERKTMRNEIRAYAN